MRSKKQKWLIRIVATILILCVSSILYINHIQSPFNTIKAKAIRMAKKEAGVKHVERVALAAFDEKSIVVIGTNKHRERILCWYTKGHLDWQYEHDGTSELRIRKILARSFPGVQIHYVNPIFFRGAYAWEAYIDFKQGVIKRTQYVYFDFLTGKKIEAYTMHP
jgi:uncharacterized protein YpmB